MKTETLLVTGCAGFIGFHAARRWLAEGGRVIGLDSLNDYYDPDLKRARLAQLRRQPGFAFVQAALEEREAVERCFAGGHRPDAVLHLAAQPGIRYSLVNPQAYVDANVTGFLNVLEACRSYGTRHLLFASSSSVYGSNTAMPFSASDPADHPISLYAATKKAGELMAHAYSHLYGIPATGLRFFTVYGPWGRPDMAVYKFTKAILAGEPIAVYNEGRMKRDFTYVDDIIEGIVQLIPRPPKPDPAWNGSRPDPSTSGAPYRIYNIGGSRPVGLLDCIAAIERALKRRAVLDLLPMQPGDVPETFADVGPLVREIGYAPKTPIEEGIPRFVEWYLAYHNKRQTFE
ncbi:NAD-dependent epimerase [Paenibacillus humicola]|uniref:NAD-dependent epimerase n=1 Tax=Paenibacillus humicola TaxID=3110540 RepID=UPI00237B523B|nr:NAD-dependent epimerase [Paenibacillus humicola]